MSVLSEATVGVWTRARALDNKANAAIERALAEALGLKARQVQIVSGHSGRRKIVEIDLPDGRDFEARLLAHAVRSGRS